MTSHDPDQLQQILRAMVEAESWPETKRIVEQHPELLSDDAEALLMTLIFTQADERGAQLLSNYLVLLQRCREEGIDAAFASLMQPPAPTATSGSAMEIPAEFRREMQELRALNEQAESDPRALDEKVAFIEGMLLRLQDGRYPVFKAGLLTELGNTYQSLTGGDPVDHLQKAIACYQEALRLRTREAFPFDYARTLVNLGICYSRLPGEDPGENLDQAIACFREALDIYTPLEAPLDYARTQHHLGSAYYDLPAGDRSQNLLQAIHCFQAALTIFTSRGEPFRYAETQKALGNAYLELPTGDRVANLSQAIACFREALTIFDPEEDPIEYAASLYSLGYAYRNLPTGDRSQNLHQAIDCFEEALTIFTPQASPLIYAKTQQNLGAAYRNLPTGDRSQNLYQAIHCFQAALAALSPGEAPVDYARIINDLGNAYATLPTGEESQNLEKAIACFQEALTILTRDFSPLEYAQIQVNLGGTYADLTTGDEGRNLEKAIASYQEALTILTFEQDPAKYAMLKTNLGQAYLMLPADDRVTNLEMAMDCFQEALTILTPQAAPLEYASIHHSLGVTYANMPSGDPAAYLDQAIAHFQEALRYRNPEAVPLDYVKTQFQLAGLHFKESQWEQAHDAYASAIRVTEALYQAAATEVARQAVLFETPTLFSNAAYCLARLGRYHEAVERLEAGKTRALAEALARDRAALAQAGPPDQAAFEAARDRIHALETDARTLGAAGSDPQGGLDFIDLSERLSAARQELAAIVRRIQAYLPHFMPAGLDFQSIAAAAQPDNPLVYLITTSRGSLGLIVPAETAGMEARSCVWMDDFRLDDLFHLLVQEDAHGEASGGYLIWQVEGNPAMLQSGLDQALPILRERLAGPLAERLLELGYAQAVLVPGGLLALLPLPAAAFEKVTLAYAPSARALHAARQAPAARAGLPPVLLGIGNPLPNPRPLPFARAEVEAIAPRFSGGMRRLLYEHQATREGVLENIAGATHLHFACHGAFNILEPLDSALFLSGGDTLKLRDLLDGDLDLSQSRLAVLSACQTGITDIRRAADEAVGLPAGFLQAGVPGVVSTLWPVADISTALLLARFYQYHLQDGLEPAAALHRAQAWLRDVSAGELAAQLRAELHRLEGESTESYEQTSQAWRRFTRMEPSEKPFAHPLYWAAFTFTGV